MITFGAPLATRPFPSVLSALRRGFVHCVKPSARALADLGFRMHDLSLNARVLPGGMNTFLHSDWSGRGGREDKGVSSALEVEVE